MTSPNWCAPVSVVTTLDGDGPFITNNPAKYSGLDGHGISIVDRVTLPAVETRHNLRYLRTKRDRLGHALPTSTAATIDAAPLLAKAKAYRRAVGKPGAGDASADDASDHVTARRLDQAGHMVHTENPAVTREAIESVLE